MNVTDLRIDDQPIGKITEVVVDYSGPNGERVLMMREPYGLPIITGEAMITIPLEPNCLVVNRRWFYALARRMMTRRGFRRWRARQRASR